MPTNLPYDESALLERISEGDEQAFTVFFGNYYARVQTFVTRFISDADQAEDAIQEAFVRVWLNRDQLLGIENIAAWVRTITSRICINILRNELTRNRHTAEHALQPKSQPDTPVEKTYASEIRNLVAIAVNNMPEARRRIYLMSREEGMKPAEIADALSLSVNTVRNVQVAALKEIRAYLSSKGHLVSLFFLMEILFDFF